jgi:hypothetical protein
MTYERAFFSSAEREKFSVSTLFLERKIMSTKTTIKRISAVAALALAFGGLTSVASQAANPNLAITVATSGAGSTAATATQLAGPANFVTITNSGSAEYYVITGGATTSGATTGTVAVGSVTPTTFNIATPAAGTITVAGYPITNGAAATTAADTLTITVVAALSGTVYASSSVLGAASGTPDATTDATFPITASAGSVGSPAVVANFAITEKDAAGTTLTSGMKALSVSSSLGTLSTSTSGLTAAGGYISGTPAAGSAAFTLSSNGQVGPATVAVSVNGVAVKSYVVTFTGAAASIVLTAVNTVIAKGTPSGVTANSNAIQIQEFDAAGNVVALNTGTLTLSPADSTVATAGSLLTSGGSFLGGGSSGTAVSSTKGGYSLNGVAVGTTTFTAKDSTGTLVSNAVTVRVSSATPTSVVFTADSAEYAAGAAGTLTTTISDAAGTVPAGTYAVLTAGATSSYALTVGSDTLPGVKTTVGSVKVNNAGVATTAFNAPIADGTNTISATGVTGVTVTPATFNVTSGGSAAANAASDAAAEATDAANAATDAANAAADSADQATAAAQDAGDKADAALAAVMALSQQVTDLLDKINALADANAQLGESLAMQSDALDAQTATLAAQAKMIADQAKMIARIVKKIKA